MRKTMDGWGEDGAGVRVGGGLERDSDIETERERKRELLKPLSSKFLSYFTFK